EGTVPAMFRGECVMKRLTSLILVLTLASLQAEVSFAQRTPQRKPGARPSGGGPGSAGSSTLERAGLKVGQQMPDVTIYDANGEKFSISRAKGKYAVLVFGCLT
ncbi:MAG: hypothetical protein O3B86_11385, partial [Planctomycetota bacterium]|nr:hypothetical protein [Planctomycetota bacterium]